MAADRWIDEILLERFRELDAVGALVSEEQTDSHDVGDGYSVAIDPLDGSSNLESNGTTGTIVGVYDAPLPASGRELVASAYALYGPYTTMTVARHDTVETFTIREGEVLETAPVSMPDGPGICGSPDERASGIRRCDRTSTNSGTDSNSDTAARWSPTWNNC